MLMDNIKESSALSKCKIFVWLCTYTFVDRVWVSIHLTADFEMQYHSY